MHHCQPNQRWSRASLGLVLQNLVTGPLLSIFPEVKRLCHLQGMGPLKTCISKVFMQWKTRSYSYTYICVHVCVYIYMSVYVYMYIQIYIHYEQQLCALLLCFIHILETQTQLSWYLLLPVGPWHLLAAGGWGSWGPSVAFKVLKNMGLVVYFTKTREVCLTPSNSLLFSTALLPTVSFPCIYYAFFLANTLYLLIWTLRLSTFLCVFHAQHFCPPLLWLLAPCTPGEGVLTPSFKAIDKPVCACTHEREHIPNMYALIPVDTSALRRSLWQAIHRLTI